MYENPPNILWICSDQQRFDTLGCYGNPYVRTPNLDKLAQEGVLFEHAYSQSPVCTPSRASSSLDATLAQQDVDRMAR